METTPGQSVNQHSQSTTEENIKQFFNAVGSWKFPQLKREEQPELINVNKTVDDKLTIGDKISDAVTSTIGSWRFIIIQSCILFIWIVLNIVLFVKYRWDPYPFILLNLALSFQAAYAAPFVMMSQNRQAVKDRLTAENDYLTDVKGEQEVSHILEHLDHQDTLVLEIVQRLATQNEKINQQEQLILELVHKIDAQQQFMKTQHQEIIDLVKTAEDSK
ncbi:DUF1003 domain-containing protein [Tengunoibacter tsumagoiensis]|uniref:DUF1003 domain-containing protein n=1 Tax=Tengunoibacter tsumagoiensis TaxID=2014871 RepID=A0A402A299_9CHLR|nr:DUF1003 domain-containing protein [Tengunoibacter tsumagoiensis]GCE13267.1 hypothetical protein KTT_31260 [Tengunoibacter tsumagoiensis]